MGASSASTSLSAVSVRRVGRTELGPVFALIQRAYGGKLTQQDLVQKATGYGYLVAEAQGRIIGVAGMLIENSIACVRDLHPSGLSMRGLAIVALIDAIETEAGALACEAVIVQVPPGYALAEALLRDRQYERKPLDQMKALWREVAGDPFGSGLPLWVNNLRKERS
jgi:hypothetical protein